MGEGRGSAVGFVMMVIVGVMLVCEVAEATTYTVGGGGGGWTFNVVGWPKGKNFKAGDTLVFNYNSRVHNVVAVNKGGYTGCTTPARSKVYQTGKDQIKLKKGQNFFICNYAGHCESGMKIAVTAL